MLIRKEVRKLKGYHLEMPVCRVKLNQNESPFDLPEPLKRKALERLSSVAWNRYPTPFCDPLRKKIAEREGWGAEGVVVTGGSNILIQAIIIAAAVRGKILTVSPGFSLYEIEGSLLGNRVIRLPLGKADFSFPRENFLKQLRKAKPDVVFIANPNAPTGNLFSEDDLLAVCAKAPGLVVIDEAYYPFSGMTMAGHLRKFPNLVIIRTLSKAFSLGGGRLGYLLADPKVVGEILKVILPFSVGILSQTVGEVVLDKDNKNYVNSVVKETLEAREALYHALKELPGLTVYPSRANFILFQSARSEEILGKLAAEGILIRNVTDRGLPNSLRVSVGTKEENRLFLYVMKKILG